MDVSGDDRRAARRDDAVGLARWMEIRDEVLRGVAHAMSNRVATISAGVWMIGETGATGGEALAALQSELEQLEMLLGQLRMLPRGDAALEPLIAGDSARAAVALHAHHGELRDIAVVIEDPGSVAPARAVPQALLHALLIALEAAKTAAGRGGTARLALSSDEAVVRFTAVADDGHDPNASAHVVEASARFATEALAASVLLAASNGRAVARPDGITLEVPTLASTRRPRG